MHLLVKHVTRVVCRSVFYLPKPRPLNHLVADLYRGPTLVLQGARDPLNDAVARANLICATCSNAELRLLEAGHCPHDERPDLFNSELFGFVRTCSQADVTNSVAVAAVSVG